MKFTSLYSSEQIGLNEIITCMNESLFTCKLDYILKFHIDCKMGNGYKVAYLTSSELEGLIDRLIQKLV